MMLATQTLACLDRLAEADRTRDLRAAVFSNLDGLFAFHTSAEDAEYLAEELLHDAWYGAPCILPVDAIFHLECFKVNVAVLHLPFQADFPAGSRHGTQLEKPWKSFPAR